MSLFSASVFTIRELAHVIGLLVSSFPGVQFGRLHYRHLELDKVEALKISKGNYDAQARLSQETYTELKWWIDNIMSAFCPIRYKHPELTLTTDASTRGWGAVTPDNRTGGLWNLQEQQYHTNYLELKAVLLGLQSLCSDVTNKHIRILTDNTTTVAYINAMGGIRSNKCNEIASEIWAWCSAQQNIWISASHIPGSANVDADKESRNASDSTEWSLNDSIYNSIAKLWGPFQIDLFASRLNFKVSNYVSWKLDPGAKWTDAFSMYWGSYYFYAFPPFSLIAQCLQKTEEDQALGTIVVPLWPTQPWFPVLLHLLVDQPRILPTSNQLLHQPHTNAPHQRGLQLKLMVCKVSGKTLDSETFRKKLPTLSCSPGLALHKSSTNITSKCGPPFVVDNRLIHMTHLSLP